MIFHLYSKLQKNFLYKKFKYIKITNYYSFKKLLNKLFKSKNSNIYIYNKFIYKYNNIKLLYILSSIKYNIILFKYINFWFNLLKYKIHYNIIYIIIIIFTYF